MNASDYPVQIRIGNAYDSAERIEEGEEPTYRNATFNEAVAALQGEHETGSYHHDTTVYVVATYPKTFTETERAYRGRDRELTRYAGQPVFGYEARVQGRGQHFSTFKDASPAWASHGSNDVAEARKMLEIYDLATRLAEAANTYPYCAACAADEQKQAEYYAQRVAEQDARNKAHDEFHAVVGGRTGHDGLAPHVHPEGTRNHADIMCVCSHKPHRGKVCRECAKESPRGPHGTQARIRKFEEAK